MAIIKRTRIKFFVVMAAIVVVIITVFCASILISTHSRNSANTDLILQNMISNVERPAPTVPPDNNRFDAVRGFTVKLNSDFTFDEDAKVNFNETVYSKEEIKEYIEKIRNTKKTNGEIGDIRFLLKDVSDGKILACLDMGMENAMFSRLMTTVLLAGGSGIAVLLVLAWFLSFWIIKPAASAFKKQKQFVSEAGHELKTPITIISAGIELLQKKLDETEREKWLQNIKEQIDRMSVMTTELLALSKIDENIKAVKTEFDLSQTVLSECLAFESVAFENGKTLTCEIDDGLMYKGDYQAVFKAIGILCDNAIKYSNHDTAINARLKKQSGKIVFSVSNESDTVNKEEVTLFFERFYRGSESRAKTNGTGLGLAILKTLAGQNGWKLNVDTLQNKITFSIIF